MDQWLFWVRSFQCFVWFYFSQRLNKSDSVQLLQYSVFLFHERKSYTHVSFGTIRGWANVSVFIFALNCSFNTLGQECKYIAPIRFYSFIFQFKITAVRFFYLFINFFFAQLFGIYWFNEEFTLGIPQISSLLMWTTYG